MSDPTKKQKLLSGIVLKNDFQISVLSAIYDHTRPFMKEIGSSGIYVISKFNLQIEVIYNCKTSLDLFC